MNSWLLLIVLIADGAVRTHEYRFADGYACNHSLHAYIAQAAELRRPILTAGCFPVSKAWGLK